MKASEYRQKSAEDLRKELVELRKEQFGLRMQRSTGQMDNPARFREIRRDVARIKTVLNEMQRAEAGAAAAPAGE